MRSALLTTVHRPVLTHIDIAAFGASHEHVTAGFSRSGRALAAKEQLDLVRGCGRSFAEAAGDFKGLELQRALFNLNKSTTVMSHVIVREVCDLNRYVAGSLKAS
mmetsp:Transcript_30362/g.63864  ORF Transcript_30362/g.63864 Transcript_30362/m.63864 type:complete len:105 (-) Transcript_30362:999-1313(-)|eukprot:6191095-Pleurochrysis_carterae.AAC.2